MYISYLANIIIYVFLIFLFYYIFFRGTRKNDVFRVNNITKNIEIARKCTGAFTFSRRVTGLLNHMSLAQGEGLYIEGASAIHVHGMKFPIDILFLDKQGTVVNLFENTEPEPPSSFLPRNKIRGAKGAYSVLELPSGTISKTGTTIGDKLEIK